MIINWRERLVVYQKPESDGFQQTSFNIANGAIDNQWLFTNYVDNGWFYDPMITIVPVNVNEANAVRARAINLSLSLSISFSISPISPFSSCLSLICD